MLLKFIFPIVAALSIHFTCWGMDLSQFNNDLLKSVNTVEDFTKDSKKVRIRAEAELQTLKANPEQSALTDDLVILFHLVSLDNAATGMKRTPQVLTNWKFLLDLHQRKAKSLWNQRIGDLLIRLTKNSEIPTLLMTPGYFASLPDEVYFQIPTSSIFKNCASLVSWSQTQPALECYTKLANHFESIGKTSEAQTAIKQKALILVGSNDIAGLEALIKSQPDHPEIPIFEVYLEQMKGNLASSDQKLASLEKTSFSKKESFISAKAKNLALHGQFFDAIQLLNPLIEKTKPKGKEINPAYLRLNLLKASFYLGAKDPGKALGVLSGLETFPKIQNHLFSILIDAQKCGLWKHLHKAESSKCEELAKTYLARLQNFSQTDNYVLTILELMKLWGKPTLSPTEAASLNQIKSQVKARKEPLDPFYLILNF